jgi:hypothetical protein
MSFTKLSLAVLLLAGSSLFAEQKDGFVVGAGYEYDMVGKPQQDYAAKTGTPDSGTSTFASVNLNAVNFKVGYDYSNFRFALNYKTTDKKSSTNVDWNVQSSEFSYNLVGPSVSYVSELSKEWGVVTGVHYLVGKMNTTMKQPGVTATLNYDMKQFGANVGAIYNVAPHNEIEFGYKAGFNSFDQIDSAAPTGIVYQTKYKNSTTSTLYIAYNYKF